MLPDAFLRGLIQKRCENILAFSGLSLDALELDRKPQQCRDGQQLEKKAQASRDDSKRAAKKTTSNTISTATATANSEECRSPVRKKQKSESPKAAVSDTPAIVVPEIELERIKRFNKKDLCAELSNLGIEHNKNWKKDELIDTWIEAKTAKPMPGTQPVGYSKYAPIDVDTIDTDPAFCAVSKSPFTKVSNDDSARSRQPEVKKNVTVSLKGPGNALPPIGSVKRAIMEREARAAAAGKLPEIVAIKSPLPMDAKKKSAPKPPSSPPQKSSSLDDDHDIKVDLNPLSSIQPEPMETEMVDEQETNVDRLSIPVPIPGAKLVVVDSDDMEEELIEPTTDINPIAVNGAACANDDECESRYETAREDMTRSQEESQRNRRMVELNSKGNMPRYNPILQSIPGSSQKMTPGKQSAHAVIPGGLVRSAVKILSSKKEKPNTAARELDFLSSSKMDNFKPKAATTGGKAARAKPLTAVLASTALPSLTANESAAAALAEQKSKRLEQMRLKSQKLHGESTAPSGTNRLATSREVTQSEITLKVREKHAQQKLQPENVAPKTKNIAKTKDLLPSAKKRAVGAAPQALFFSDKKSTRHAPAFQDEENPYNLDNVVCHPEDNYELTDTEASDYEADSDDEYERQRSKKQPSWARSENLRNALAQQHSLDYPFDPDVLFGEVETCDLVAIFNVTDKSKQIRLRRRRSSGTWDNDRLTESEKENYKRRVCAMNARSTAK